MNSIEFTAEIEHKGGKDILNYSDKKWKEKWDRFKSANCDKKIIIHVEVQDSPEHFLHKYYRSHLLPAITNEMGEIDKEYVHRFYMKKKFLFVEIENLEEIPEKHSKRPTIYTDHRENEKGEMRTVVLGYAPSTGDITHKAMQNFVKEVEMLLFVGLGGSLTVDGVNLEKFQRKAEEYRKLGMRTE